MTRDYRNAQTDAWFRRIVENPAEFPFSFCLDGERFEGFGDSFEEVSRKAWEEDETQTVELCFRHGDALFITLCCTHYPLYGATDWIVWFENRGDHDTGVLSDAESVLRFEGGYPTLKGILGDHTNWYRPYALDVGASPRYFESNSGRATHVNFPYFNLEFGDGGAFIIK